MNGGHNLVRSQQRSCSSGRRASEWISTGASSSRPAGVPGGIPCVPMDGTVAAARSRWGRTPPPARFQPGEVAPDAPLGRGRGDVVLAATDGAVPFPLGQRLAVDWVPTVLVAWHARLHLEGSDVEVTAPRLVGSSCRTRIGT